MYCLQLFALACAFIIGSVCSALPLYAQWQPTNGPFHNNVYSLLTLESAVLAGTDTGIYISTDGGKNWLCTYSVESSQYIFPVNGSSLTFCIDGPAIYAGTQQGIVVSRDGGNTWKAIGTTLTRPRLLAVHNHRLFATVSSPGRLQFSDDEGTTWQDIKTENLYGGAMAIASDGSNLIMIQGRNDMTSNNVYRSVDNGETWTLVEVGGEYLYYADSAFYVSDRGTVHRSFNGGATWLSSISGIPLGASARAMMYHDNLLFAAMNTNEWTSAGIYTSTNNGATWSLYKKLTDGVNCLGIIDTNIVAGLFRKGLFVLKQDGDVMLSKGFTSTSTVYHLCDANGALHGFVNSYNRVYSLPVGASEWVAGTQLSGGRVATLASYNNRLFAGLDSRDSLGSPILFSDDAGATWHEPEVSAMNAIITSFAEKGGVLFASGVGYDNSIQNIASVWYSTDNGNTWEPSEFLSNTYYLARHKNGLLAMGSDTVFYSDDGKHWSVSGVSLIKYAILSTFTSNGSTAFIGYNSSMPTAGLGIAVSTDNGATVYYPTEGLPESGMLVHDFAVYGRYVFAGGSASGSKSTVLVSADSGATWKNISDNIGGNGVLTLVISGDYLYAGTDASAIWRRPLSEVVASVGEPEVQAAYSVQPHPVVATSVLQLDNTCELHNATLVLSALGGQRVRTVSNLYGISVSIERGNLAPGVYAFTLEEAGQVVASGTLVVE